MAIRIAFINIIIPIKNIEKHHKEVFNEPEFKNRFRLVVFAILDDHNSWKEHNPEGNILPFLQDFETEFNR